MECTDFAIDDVDLATFCNEVKRDTRASAAPSLSSSLLELSGSRGPGREARRRRYEEILAEAFHMVQTQLILAYIAAIHASKQYGMFIAVKTMCISRSAGSCS